MNLRSIIMLAAVFSGGTSGAFGASINVNFTGISGRPVEGTAGVWPASNWNNAPGTTGAREGLLDSDGTATAASLSWEAQASWQTNPPFVNQNTNLMDGYLAVGVQDYEYDITITGIPYANYDVYVYFGNNIMGVDGNIRINSGGTQYFYRTAGILPDFTGFRQVTERQSADPKEGNFVLFEDIAGATLTIQTANINGGPDSGVMGFQIVDRGAAVPFAALDDSIYSSDEAITVSFTNGPGAAENNFVIVEYGADPAAGFLARRYVGGGTTPGTGPSEGTVTFDNAGGQTFGWFDLYWLEGAGGAALRGPETFQILPPEPVPVPVGAGSYASFPPAHEGAAVLAEVLERRFYIDPSAADRPVPTNDWWTDLIISQYAGQMWAYPLTLAMDGQGVNVFYPTQWPDGGREMILDDPIRVMGTVEPETGPSVIPVADFEAATYLSGWTSTGTAFGSGPAAGALPGQGPVTGFIGERLVNSFNGGDGPVGTLSSPAFTIDRNYIHLLVGGGNHPGTAAVNLIVGGSAVRSETGQDSENLTWRTWDVSALQGESAAIEIVDQETGGWGHILCDQIFQSDDPSHISGAGGTVFSPTAANALDWGDWTVAARLPHSSSKHLDVTFGHGLPFAWFEPANVEPFLLLGDEAAFFDESGRTLIINLPTTRDFIGIRHGGRAWGLFLPENTTLQFDGATLAMEFASTENWFVLGALPGESFLTLFNEYAYSLPRNSLYSWDYLPEEGIVRTTWELVTEQLRGPDNGAIQGWIPHHYRDTENDFAFADGVAYGTPRGQLRGALGSTFTIDFPFAGLAPNVPPPVSSGLPNDFDAAILDRELGRAATVTNYGADTYFGGKDIHRMAQYMAAGADAASPHAATLMNNLRAALVDWYTYTPGETEHYFVRYPNWRALVGFNESFGAFQFTDHHFHYGYHTICAGMLGLYDPAFAADYGQMARLVAKEYANWERDDLDFPFLRTFDIWKGHSQAAGLSSPAGNNQESSSEAINSWAGLFFLGAALGDDAMRDAGAMGYAIETRATMEYWFDYYGDNLPAEYPKTMVGILFDSGPAFATFFSGDPAWMNAIQWLPLQPAVMGYFQRDLPFARQIWTNMVIDRIDFGDPTTDIGEFDANLGGILLGYQALIDPDFAASEWNRLDAADNPVVNDIFLGGILYYFIHSMRTLGPVSLSHHMSEPLGSVFHNPDTGTTTYLAFNPGTVENEITVYEEGTPIGCFVAAPGVLTSVTSLNPCATNSAIPDAFIVH